MSREDAIDDLLARIAVAAGTANELGLDLAGYLLKVAMLEVVERGTNDYASRALQAQPSGNSSGES
jgi:hypothetical protein